MAGGKSDEIDPPLAPHAEQIYLSRVMPLGAEIVKKTGSSLLLGQFQQHFLRRARWIEASNILLKIHCLS